MNILEFEVHNQILKRIDSQEVMNRNEHVYKCQFTFEEESEWINLNKFVIFKDGWGNSSTVHLGKKGNVLSCLIPDKVLRGSYFQVSIYAGDLITTNNVSIMLIQSGYSNNRGYCPPHNPFHHYPYDNPKPHLHHPHNPYACEGDIFVEIFNRLDNVVDSIIYDNKTLHLFGYESLIESIYLPFVDEEEFEGLTATLVERFINNNLTVATDESDGLFSSEDKVKLDSIEFGANKTVIDTELNSDSDNAISNKCVVEALNGKEDSYDIVERIDELIVDLIEKGE